MDPQLSSKTFPSPKRTAVTTISILTVLHALYAATLVIIGYQTHQQPMLISGLVTFAIPISGIISIVLCQRGRIQSGIWLTIVSICLGMPVTTLWVSGNGWVIAISVSLAVTITALINDSARIGRAVLLGSISGALGLIVDLFGSTDRPTMPNTQIVVPIVVGILLVVVVVLLLRQFRTLQLRMKLLVLFLLVALIPLGILFYVNNQITRNTVTETAQKLLTAVASQTAYEIDGFIGSTLELIKYEAQIPIFQTAIQSEADLHLNILNDSMNTMVLLQAKDPDYLKSYILLDLNGEYILSSPPINNEMPPFLGIASTTVNEMQDVLQKGNPYVSPVIIDPITNQKSIFFAAQVFSPEDEPIGILLARYNAAILQEILVEKNGAAGSSSFGVLLDEYHILQAHGLSPSFVFRTVAPLSSQEVDRLTQEDRLFYQPAKLLTVGSSELESKLATINTNPIFTLEDEPTIGGRSQASAIELTTQPWVMVFFQPEEVLLAPADQQTRTNIVLGLAVIGLLTIVSIFATRLVSAPITNLTELVERISSGDLTLQVPILSQDEIGKLASAFNSMTAQIRNLLGGLELQVSERTQELQRQTLLLQTASEVARDATATQDLETLLNNAVNLISKRFDYYHAGIFLLDQPGEYAMLKAANSEGGKKMLAQGHKLAVGQVGIVGDTTATGEPHIALDVGEDRVHAPNPNLPDTRSEMALPLKVGNTVIGALDVQSTKKGAFDENDIAVLQIMADQLAIAIRNSQLLEEVQFSIFELQSAYGEYTQRSWKEWQQHAGFSGGYRYQSGNLQTAKEMPSRAALAYKRGRPVQTVTDDRAELAVPIQLRDSTFGTINLEFEGGEVSTEIASLTGKIAERLALALDNARLLETTQQKAMNEQLIREMTDQIRQTLDIETIIKTAAKEISSKLGLAALDIQLDTTMQNETIPDSN
jgi:GAF domain-containing protein/HAMP domain-containing protein